jgi:two-component system sensor histidine kinase CiaH
VSLLEENGKIRLTVSDEGQAIPNHEKEKIFDKFYRIGDENTRKAKGTGLGLYLCKKIAESHNGQISVTDNQPAGSNFTASFRIT